MGKPIPVRQPAHRGMPAPGTQAVAPATGWQVRTKFLQAATSHGFHIDAGWHGPIVWRAMKKRME
ncbi:hypothetical protein BGC31_00810 [Komagataeibacter xylinus]|nr:hypothetical protein BGC31_00810 [Komagataeibacter xylinus]RFP06152.1 hypothetical protein BFX83_12430 [Komagataeibacter xylinus]